MKTLEQGIYADLPIDDYIRDPAPEPSLSTRTAQALVDECPLRAWHNHPRLNPEHGSEDNAATDLGKMAHAVLLEGGTDKLVVAPFADWRSKAARELRDAARAEGKIPILEGKLGAIMAMVKVAQAALLKAAPEVGVFKEMLVERTMIWKEDGVWCRSRPDAMPKENERPVILEYKTTGTCAHPATFARQMISMGYDLQAALIRAGYHAIIGQTPDVVFLVQETEAPYLCSFVGMEPSFADAADRKLEIAIKRWKECMETNTWPGYPSRVCWTEMPPWEFARVEALE